MKKSRIIISLLIFICSGTVHAQAKDSEISVTTMPILSVYGGYPEYFSFDFGGDILISQEYDFPISYGLYIMGSLGNGSDITNIRLSGGLSLQHDYVGLKIGVGGEFSGPGIVNHEPFFFAEAILRLWIFDFKILYDFGAESSSYTITNIFLVGSGYDQNPKFYAGIDLWMCIMNILNILG